MSPFEHGEVFVLDDGGETDLVRSALPPSLSPSFPPSQITTTTLRPTWYVRSALPPSLPLAFLPSIPNYNHNTVPLTNTFTIGFLTLPPSLPPSLPMPLPQDLGNYERFLHVRLTNDSNLTTGKVYQSVIERERKGEYLGKYARTLFLPPSLPPCTFSSFTPPSVPPSPFSLKPPPSLLLSFP